MSEAPEPLEAMPVLEPDPDPVPDPVPDLEPETEFADLEVDAPRVGILASSKEELHRLAAAERELTQRGHRCELRVLSAHGEPDQVADYARNAKLRGLRLIIAAGSLSAALPGFVAAHTALPVIGVPLSTPSSVAGGLDAILALVQAPAAAPVACVGVDNAEAAAELASRILEA